MGMMKPIDQMLSSPSRAQRLLAAYRVVRNHPELEAEFTAEVERMEQARRDMRKDLPPVPPTNRTPEDWARLQQCTVVTSK